MLEDGRMSVLRSRDVVERRSDGVHVLRSRDVVERRSDGMHTPAAEHVD